MRIRATFMAPLGLIGALALGMSGFLHGQAAAAKDGEERQADRDAIERAAREYAAAFAKGDATAIASQWTEQGELQDETGQVFRGRTSIEKAYSEFFKRRPKGRIEIEIHSIHFPGRDIAIEEGRAKQSQDGPDLPTSSEYSAIHVREDGEWKIAACREFAAGGERLHDLDWLIGKWAGSANDHETVLTFEKEKSSPFIVGTMTKKYKGEVVASGTLKIGADPQTGQLRSWHFNNDGSHGQALWRREGNQWLLDSRNVLANGEGSAALNILFRTNENTIVWRSVERVLGNQAQPDAAPLKLTRIAPNQ